MPSVVARDAVAVVDQSAGVIAAHRPGEFPESDHDVLCSGSVARRVNSWL